MPEITMPDSVVGDIQTADDIARGPFVAVHNGFNCVGAHMRHNGDEVTFWDGSRTQSIDDTYTIRTVGEKVTARSSVYSSTFLFRPLELDDQDWIYADPNDRPGDLEQLIYLVTDALSDPF